MTVRDVRKALQSYKDDENIYIAVLGHDKSAVFDHLVVGENHGAVQLSVFADTDTEGITEVALDLLNHDGSIKSLLSRKGA